MPRKSLQFISFLQFIQQKQKEELRKENDELRQKAKRLKKDLENVQLRNGCKFYWGVIRVLINVL